MLQNYCRRLHKYLFRNYRKGCLAEASSKFPLVLSNVSNKINVLLSCNVVIHDLIIFLFFERCLNDL